MNIIVVGCGKIGSAITKALNDENHDIAVIDIDTDTVNSAANSFDVIGVEGNGASIQTQRDAGIANANLLIATAGSDEVNILCCMIAKKANKNISTIARVRNPVYREEINYFKEELGLSMVLNPELLAAREIARLLRFPFALKIDTLLRDRIEILRHRIKEGSPLGDIRVMDVNKKLGTDVLICTIERDGEVFIPNGASMLFADDLISFVASPEDALKFFRSIREDTHQVKDTIIAGGGKIAFYLAQQLLSLGIGTKIIEMDRKRCEELDDSLDGATIICGDGTDQELLLEEGIEYTESVVPLTNIDEENILLALYAKKMNPNVKCITKVNRVVFDDLMENIDLGTIMHTKSIVADRVTSFARAMQNSMGSNVETLVHISDDKAEALEFNVTAASEVTDKPLSELDLKTDLLIAAINRGKTLMFPKGQDMICAGDRVIVVTTHKGLNDITDILKK
ncbi:MAG: Trk system potassium transporter TrkA [Lachnospiraceae bacterium]|nr:Trk system potassium transporter TrkA [Lachnospiraceae bacterium]MBR5375779.1 Trk system potassium transporter TrkA [Lachnospiraceae bacterium]